MPLPSPVRAGRDFLYVAGGLPLGIAWFTFLITALSVGLSLVIVMLGIPILAVSLLVWRWGADTERERAALVLGAPIRRPAPRPPRSDRFLDRWVARVRDRWTWRALAYMLLLGPLGIAGGMIVCTLWSAAVAALLAPVFAAGAPDGSFLGDLSFIDALAVAASSVLIAGLALAVTRGLALGGAALASGLLADDAREQMTERIATLETSRSGAVESADARLRRIERDLHDGAQHRLAYIAMELGRARAKLPEDPAAVDTLLAGAHDESKRAMRELRDLVRGHPPVRAERPRARRRALRPRRSARASRSRSTARWPSGSRPRSRPPPTTSSPRRSRTSAATRAPRAPRSTCGRITARSC